MAHRRCIDAGRPMPQSCRRRPEAVEHGADAPAPARPTPRRRCSASRSRLRQSRSMSLEIFARHEWEAQADCAPTHLADVTERKRARNGKLPPPELTSALMAAVSREIRGPPPRPGRCAAAGPRGSRRRPGGVPAAWARVVRAPQALGSRRAAQRELARAASRRRSVDHGRPSDVGRSGSTAVARWGAAQNWTVAGPQVLSRAGALIACHRAQFGHACNWVWPGIRRKGGGMRSSTARR